MATVFLEPGGDATGNVAATTAGGFWRVLAGAPAVATDFVHGTHTYSIKYRPNNLDTVKTPLNILSQAGGRVSFWIYLNVLPGGVNPQIFAIKDSVPNTVVGLNVSSAGVLKLVQDTNTQLGSNGATLTAGQWYHISIAWTITSTTVNQFAVFVNGVSSISVINGTLNNASANNFWIGNNSNDGVLDFRSSDHYSDNSTALTDPGNIWVASKRPFSNGTTNGFTTQIGSGGSGYGSGHAPQVNEVPLSTTNGWSMIGAGSAVTEEYTIEGQSVGFVSTAGGTIIDFEGWVDASSATSETAQIIVVGATSNISLTATDTVFTKIAGSSTYPAGGTDIGIVTGTTLTTVGLYECGIIVAFIPAATTTGPNLLSALGAG